MSEDKSAAEKIKERLDLDTSGSSSGSTSESKGDTTSKASSSGETEDTGPIDIAEEDEEEPDVPEEPPKGSPEWKLKEGKPLAEAEKKKLAQKKQQKAEEEGISRRSFLGTTLATVSGTVAFGAGIGTCSVAAGRYMMPNVQYKPPQVFKAGYPASYEVGTVETKYKAAQRAWIIRTEYDPFVEKKGFYAIFAKCTHLGCTPNWLSSQEIFKCPCHGSGFRKTGENFEGPAPRPLERYRIYLGEDGQITVDKSATFQAEKGEWSNPEAFLAESALS